MTKDTSGSEPAFPQGEFQRTNAGYNGGQLDVCKRISGGLTKREYIAIAAMQGLLALPCAREVPNDEEYIAEWSCKYADALIAMLAEGGKQ